MFLCLKMKNVCTAECDCRRIRITSIFRFGRQIIMSVCLCARAYMSVLRVFICVCTCLEFVILGQSFGMLLFTWSGCGKGACSRSRAMSYMMSSTVGKNPQNTSHLCSRLPGRLILDWVTGKGSWGREGSRRYNDYTPKRVSLTELKRCSGLGLICPVWLLP